MKAQCRLTSRQKSLNRSGASSVYRTIVHLGPPQVAYRFPACGPFLWKLSAFGRPFFFRARYNRGATQSNLEQIMPKGTVKWFNPTKGYGFIQSSGGGKDVFVHISAVERAGLSNLNEGQVVEFEEVSNRGKTSAENLKVQR